MQKLAGRFLPPFGSTSGWSETPALCWVSKQMYLSTYSVMCCSNLTQPFSAVVVPAQQKHSLWNPTCRWMAFSLHNKPYHGMWVEQALCCSPASLPSWHALKGLHCFTRGISSSQNKMNSSVKCTDKGFPFQIQQLKNSLEVDFLLCFQGFCLGFF